MSNYFKKIKKIKTFRGFGFSSNTGIKQDLTRATNSSIYEDTVQPMESATTKRGTRPTPSIQLNCREEEVSNGTLPKLTSFFIL